MRKNQTHIRIGSRGSKLALWQANHVRELLARRFPEAKIFVTIIKTTGDKILGQSLAKIVGKGVFTREIEEALLKKRIDLAVHSLKDLPTSLPRGLKVSAVTRREDARDAMLSLTGVRSVLALRSGARVGTSSLRRRAQLLRLRPDLQIEDLRGNLDTRVSKLTRGEYDAIVLASAGLKRLGLALEYARPIPLTQMLPAPGQGALAIETRENDELTNRQVSALNHPDTAASTTAERALLGGLGGGCLVPIAAHAQVRNGILKLRALVASADGTDVVEGRVSGTSRQAAILGHRLANRLLQRGASRLLGMIVPESAEDEPTPYMPTPRPTQPLVGKRILITRAASQVPSLARQLQELGADVVAIPAIDIAPPSDSGPLDRAMEQVDSYDWLIFTSANAVEYFFKSFTERRLSNNTLKKVKIAVVGPGTAARLRVFGFRPNLIPEQFAAEGLLEALQKKVKEDGGTLAAKKILFPRARVARELLPAELNRLGACVDVVEVYRTVSPPGLGSEVRRELLAGPFTLLIFTSSSAVSNLASALGVTDLSAIFRGADVACIGGVTAETARLHGLTVTIKPADSTIASTLEAVRHFYSCTPQS